VSFSLFGLTALAWSSWIVLCAVVSDEVEELVCDVTSEVVDLSEVVEETVVVLDVEVVEVVLEEEKSAADRITARQIAAMCMSRSLLGAMTLILLKQRPPLPPSQPRQQAPQAHPRLVT
jgi:hypothetical protein